MNETNKLVILECGISLSTFTTHFLKIRKLSASIIANSTCDFIIKSSEEEQKDLWIPVELVNLIKGLIPDDLSKSPLAMLYLRSHFNQLIPLAPDDQFLANWLSSIRSLHEKEYVKAIEDLLGEVVKTSQIPVNVFPLNFEFENAIELIYRDQKGYIRLYQMFGQLNLEKKFIINPTDIVELIGEMQQKKFSFEDDKKIITQNARKNFDSAQCIVISPSDLTSLIYMLNNKELRKVINDSKASIVTVSPLISRKETNSKENPLLRLIGKTYSFDTLIDSIKDISDILVVDVGDPEIAKSAQEKGLQVIVEDLVYVKDSYSFINTVLKELDFNILEISI